MSKYVSNYTVDGVEIDVSARRVKNKDGELLNIIANAGESHAVTGDREDSVSGNMTAVVEGNETTSVKGTSEKTISKSKTETVGGDVTVGITGGKTETVGGDVTVGITGGKTETVGGDTSVSVSGDKTETVDGSVTETDHGYVHNGYGDFREGVSGEYKLSVNKSKTETIVGDSTEDVSGAKIVNAKSADETVTGSKNVSIGSGYSITIENDLTTSANNLIENIGNNKTTTVNGLNSVLGNKLFVNTDNPIKYSKPYELSNKFKAIKMLDTDDTEYELLVKTDDTLRDDLYINVKDYGATGDGTTDDTEAIQYCIDNFTGKTIFIPSGTYNVGTITLKSNTVITGSGINSILKGRGEDILVTEGYYDNKGKNPSTIPFMGLFLSNFKIDGGFYSDTKKYVKSGLTTGNGLLVYGAVVMMDNVFIVNNPENGFLFETSNAQTNPFDKALYDENRFTNCVIALNGEYGMILNKVYDSFMTNCSINTNGQKNGLDSSDYSNLKIDHASIKMSDTHLSSLYGNAKPNSSLFVSEGSGVVQCVNCHIEGAMYPLAQYANYGIYIGCYIYGSFGFCDVVVTSAYNQFVGCMFGKQVSDDSHSGHYPTWLGAFVFNNKTAYNSIDGVFFGTSITSSFDNMGYNNKISARGNYTSKIVNNTTFPTTSDLDKVDFDINGAWTDYSMFKSQVGINRLNARGCIGNNVSDAISMTGDLYVTQHGYIFVITSYSSGTIYINEIASQGCEVKIVNKTSSSIPVNGTGGITVDGVTYPTTSSVKVSANSTKSFISISSSAYVSE